MKIGVISDTHGYLDPSISQVFQGVNQILHAGDIGPQSIISELEKIAPVTAVTGNTDSFIPYEETEVITLGGLNFILHHIVDLANPHQAILSKIKMVNASVVIFGHTHKPFAENRDGILYFNPGYAGKQRFDLKRTVGILTLSAKGIAYKWVDLYPNSNPPSTSSKF